MATVEITRVDENTMKLVYPWLRTVRRLVKELSQVDFEGEFVAIVDLRQTFIELLMVINDNSTTHLDHSITLDVIFKALELQVQHRREGLENDTLLGVLEPVSFCLVLVLPV